MPIFHAGCEPTVSSLFSLLMPSYNQAHFIREAVESVLTQDDADWELWILDNSTDETPQIMQSYTDPRIHFVHEDRRMDPGSCLNWMLKQAKGECFSYIHTDNRLLPSFVGSHRKVLAAHPLALAVCDYWEIDEAGHRRKIRRRPDPFPLRCLFSVDTIGVPFAATMALAKDLGGFSASDLADDVLFVLRADTLGPRIHIRKPQMEYRVHGGSRFLSSGSWRVQQAIYRSLLQAYRERPGGLADPFEQGDQRAIHHMEVASRMAILRAREVLRLHPQQDHLWVSGTGPASFWLAWGCFQLGVDILGFVDVFQGELLGLPVQVALPIDGVLLDPVACRGMGESFRWLLRGLPPLDHPLKRLPGEVMCSLLAPFHYQTPEAHEILIRGGGAIAAYLAYGAEILAGLKVVGLETDGQAVWPPLEAQGKESTGTHAWVVPGNQGDGTIWCLPSRR